MIRPYTTRAALTAIVSITGATHNFLPRVAIEACMSLADLAQDAFATNAFGYMAEIGGAADEGLRDESPYTALCRIHSHALDGLRVLDGLPPCTPADIAF